MFSYIFIADTKSLKNIAHTLYILDYIYFVGVVETQTGVFLDDCREGIMDKLVLTLSIINCSLIVFTN